MSRGGGGHTIASAGNFFSDIRIGVFCSCSKGGCASCTSVEKADKFHAVLGDSYYESQPFAGGTQLQ